MAASKGTYYITSNKDGVRISRQITEEWHDKFLKQLEEDKFNATLPSTVAHAPLFGDTGPTPIYTDPTPPPGTEEYEHEHAVGFVCKRCNNGRFVLGNGEPRTCNTCAGTGWISEQRWLSSTLPYIRRCLEAGSIDALTLANAIEGCVKVFGASRPPRGLLHVNNPAIISLWVNECEGLYNATKVAKAEAGM